MSVERLAEAANLSVSHISKAERAQCEIGLKALLKISTAFGMKAPWILPCAGHIAGMVEEAVQASGLCILNMYNSLQCRFRRGMLREAAEWGNMKRTLKKGITGQGRK